MNIFLKLQLIIYFFFMLLQFQISLHVKSTKYITMPLTFQLSDVSKVECVLMSFDYRTSYDTLSNIFQTLSVESIDKQGNQIIINIHSL